MTAPRQNCRCCSGSGLVEAYTGDMRPCSRCRVDDFHTWYVDLIKARNTERTVETEERD